VQVTNHSVTLIWEEPAENEGPKPNGYEVRFKKVNNDSFEPGEPQVRIYTLFWLDPLFWGTDILVCV